MKRFAVLMVFMCGLGLVAVAQNTALWVAVTVNPSGVCSGNPVPEFNQTTGVISTCQSGTWGTVSGGSFTAGGDLSGSSSSQEVTGILSHALPSVSAGYLQWTGSAYAWSTPGGAGNVNGSGTSVSGNFPVFTNTSSTGIGPSAYSPSSFLASSTVLPANTTATAHNFFTAYNSSTGAFTQAQPAFTDISGTPSTTQVPFQSLTTTGSGSATLSSGVLNIPTPGSAFITALTTTGTSGAAAVSSGTLNIPQYAAQPSNSATLTTCTNPTSSTSSTSTIYQVSSTCALTLPTGATGLSFGIQNGSTSTLTVAPPSGTITIGATTTANLTIPNGQSVSFFWNGTSYQVGNLPTVASTGVTITPGATGNVITSSSSGGTVTSIATTSPITGGTITSTGTIACATCVTSAAALTANGVVIGSGGQGEQVIAGGTGVLYQSSSGSTPIITNAPFVVANANPYDSSSQAANDSYVQSAVNLTMATTPLTITGGTISFDSQGSGATLNYSVTSGAITTINSWSAVGSGYAVGDVITPQSGNYDAMIRITAINGSNQPTAGTILYGGTGYSAGTGVAGSSANTINYTFLLSGTLTSAATFIMPHGTYLTQSNQWIFANNTTGSFSTTVCVAGATDACSGGRTVVVAQGTNNSREVTIQTDGELNVDLQAVQNAADLAGSILTSASATSPIIQTTTSGVVATSFAASLLNYGGNGNGSTDNSTAMTSACAANSEVWLPAGAYAFTSNYTVTCALHFGAGASLVAPTGVTVALNGAITAPTVQIFTVSGTGAFTIGSTTPAVYAEWWGVTGTADQVPINAAFKAAPKSVVQLLGKTYNTTAAITFASAGQVLQGASVYLTLIGSSSATADIVSTGGFSYPMIQNLLIYRTVAGSAGANGINLTNSQWAYVNNTVSQDNPNAYYLSGTANPYIYNSVVTYTSVSSTGVQQSGFNIDSTTNANASVVMLNDTVINVSGGSSLPVYGRYLHGAHCNDYWSVGFQTAKVTYGSYVNCTASSSGLSASDVHFYGDVHDGYYTSAHYVTGFSNTGSANLEINGGDVSSSTASGPAIDLESANGVHIDNVDSIENPSVVKINGGGNNSVRGMVLAYPGIIAIGPFFSLIGTSHNVIADNIFQSGGSGSTGTDIALTSTSVYNIVHGNSLSGYATVGISTDSSSCNNQLVPNVIDPTNITTPLSSACSTNSVAVGPGTGFTTGYFAQAATSTSLSTPLHLDDGVTTSGTITSSEPVNTNTGGLGTVATGHIIGNSIQNIANVVFGAAVGTPTSTSIVGSDMSGDIYFTTGTVVGTGTILTLTFNDSYGAAPHCQLTDQGSLVWHGLGTIPTTTTMPVTDAVALTSTTAYDITYSCGQ